MMQTKSVLQEESSKTIRISFKTYKELAELGTFGDSFDSIIRNLLSNKEKMVKEGPSS
jgi:predicted CopG family antitoxin